MQENWRNFKAAFVGNTKNVKGFGRIAVLASVALVLVVAVAVNVYATQNKEAGDLWGGSGSAGVVRIRSNGDYDSDGGAVFGGVVTAANVVVSGAASDGLRPAYEAIATYSYADDGGDFGRAIDLGVDVPDNAIVYGGYIDTTSALLPMTNTATISIGLNTASDLLAASSATTNFASAGIDAIVPVWTAATAFKTTNSLPIRLTISAAPLTGGVFTVHLYYGIGD